MTSNPFFSGRIPQGLYDRIEEYRQQTEESKTEILIRALAQYVNYSLEENTSPPPPIQKTFDEIFKRLEALESEIWASESILDQNEVIISDNSTITESTVNDLQEITSDNDVITDPEMAKILNCDRSTLGKVRRKLLKGEPSKSKLIAQLSEYEPLSNGWRKK